MVTEEEKTPEAIAPEEQDSNPDQTETAAETSAAQAGSPQEKIRELEDRLLRMAAEQDNFKKRMQRERETAFKYAEEHLLRELLPSLDNLERAIEQGKSSSDAAALLSGVEMTCKGLLNTLEKFGVKAVAGAGQAFDPNYHEALGMEPSDTLAENLILHEFQKGYLFKDRLLRAAKVVVSKGKVTE